MSAATTRSLDALVEKTYAALLTVVQTTALSRKVLSRPPFTFLHKLLVETLGDYDIFTSQQLEFAELVTKEDKAAFLTRAIAFVTFAMATINSKRISCLLLVSPVKVLAGVAVEDTHEFLLQLCDVCKSPDREAKDAAAQDVVFKGDAQLYTTGVSFRKGLLLIQAIVRSFIKRRARKKKALQSGAPPGAAVASPALLMAPHTRFLKELADGRVYDGVIREVNAKIYVLGYEQDPVARDEVDEIEMKIIMEESQRLTLLRERMTAKAAAADDDADISLTGLPDLSLRMPALEAAKPKLIKRASLRDTTAAATPKRVKSTLSRSLSQRSQLDASPSSSRLREEDPTVQRSEWAEPPTFSGMVPDSSDRPMAPPVADNETGTRSLTLLEPEASSSSDTESSSAKPWQTSLKKLLASGQLAQHTDAARNPKALTSLSRDSTSSGSRPSSNNGFQTPHLLNFPKLSIPGTKTLTSLPLTSKQRLRSDNNAAAAPSSLSHGGRNALGRNKSQLLPTPTTATMATSRALPGGGGTRGPTAEHRSASVVGGGNDSALDAAFLTGAYQTTDQKTQAKLALFREIVRRIDGYMKRKHLRVIDLFRFCDADGNGSISPQEMIDTLSQMEIQLAPEQAQAFINHIDKDGNGSIDIDEFEELVRVARRSEAQREQLRKELSHAKKSAAAVAVAVAEPKPPAGRFSALAKHRQRIHDAFRAADVGQVGALSTAQLRATLLRLDLPGVDEVLVDTLIERALAVALPAAPVATNSRPSSSSSTHTHATLSTGSATTTTPSAAAAAAGGGGGVNGMVYLHQVCKSLEELEWGKRANRFLDPSWLSQFDAQMERAVREFELL
ncbi:hypothetical protein PybrP1_003563 [[Pythium] brassicae (nom. inval.)]|nr:hypothetical protein PybrP1_003563 [[Pythium] brassicae (nom. inval.)]